MKTFWYWNISFIYQSFFIQKDKEYFFFTQFYWCTKLVVLGLQFLSNFLELLVWSKKLTQLK